MNNKKEKRTNQSGKALVYVILAIVIVAILVGGYLFINNSNPEKVFVSSINKTIDTYKTGLTSKQNVVNTTVALSGNIEAENEQVKQMAQYINESKITLNVQTDTNAKKSYLALDVDYQNEKLLSGNAYYADGDENLYFYVQDLFDKYFKININEAIKDEEQREQIKQLLQGKTSLEEKVNINKVAEILKKEITQKLSGKTFEKEKADGLTKNTIKLTFNELTQIVKDIATDLKNNQEFLGSFQNQENVSKALENLIEEVSDVSEEDKGNLEISIYTKGLLVQTVEKIEVKAIASEEEQLTATIQEKEKNNYECVIDVPNQAKITLNMEIKQENATTIENINVSNSVDINNISEADSIKLYTNLSKMRIYTLFSSLAGGMLSGGF